MTAALDGLSAEGRRRLQRELELLRGERRPELLERLRASLEAAHGDFGEMGEHQELQLEQERMEARIAELEELLGRPAHPRAPHAGGVALGSTVLVRGEAGEEERYTLVDPAEADPRHGRIPVDSPVAQALVGHRAGDTVTVQTPEGVRQLAVLAVQH